MEKLSSVNDASLYEVKALSLSSEERKRLGELGIIVGTRIKFLFSAPSGEPRAFLVRGAQLAFREDYTENIWVSKEFPAKGKNDE